MTIHEAHERYNIPLEVLREYENWGRCGPNGQTAGAWQYDDVDLERLNLIMTLRGAGLASSEIKNYMELLKKEDTETQRMQMLDRKRESTLHEIHLREKQLEHLDYLRYHVRIQKDAKREKRSAE